jgi:hypothetical protein
LKRFLISLKPLSMSDKQTPNQAFNLNRQLDRYFLACSALVGVATLAGTQESNASIVWSGPLNMLLPTTNGQGGIYINFENNGFFIPPTGGSSALVNANLPGWDVNLYRSGGGNIRIDYHTSLVAITGTVANGSNHVKPLTGGTLIDGSILLGTYKTMVPEWLGVDAYLGFQFEDSSTALHYGWMHLITSPDNPPDHGLPATIVDWAWENTSAGIVAGAVPEPGSIALGCLAAGAAGVSVWRKRKKA